MDIDFTALRDIKGQPGGDAAAIADIVQSNREAAKRTNEAGNAWRVPASTAELKEKMLKAVNTGEPEWSIILQACRYIDRLSPGGGFYKNMVKALGARHGKEFQRELPEEFTLHEVQATLQELEETYNSETEPDKLEALQAVIDGHRERERELIGIIASRAK